ncbi:T. brucei spp.-specific protein [Trypanosoma brucei gambiense DAL972]|uniref:T. brucei spp.-specific protein n=1 Tax=Trypanosoma brucei gambiense (strain MHOM/CI/86/DAL972) TaxID=679716 RepID=C9ZNC6_TRYB9|nr:T. brucei spp.-specific protein [Trypanosoma brucei gambiense DAL972]CBH10904.1 T. brucei spp.-specific protein [Trypanosoma brucei gambiense DAL972]|eukprot:XP_011773191.1 T. brucei spp.-specific protein [Trypanosoma brucei gambiense DAL972]
MGARLRHSYILASVITAVAFAAAEKGQRPALKRFNKEGARALCIMYGLAGSMQSVADGILKSMHDKIAYIEEAFVLIKARHEEVVQMEREEGETIEDAAKFSRAKKELEDALEVLDWGQRKLKEQHEIIAGASRKAVEHAKKAVGDSESKGMNKVLTIYCNTTVTGAKEGKKSHNVNNNCDDGIAAAAGAGAFKIDCKSIGGSDNVTAANVTYEAMSNAINAWDGAKPGLAVVKHTSKQWNASCISHGYASEGPCTVPEEEWTGDYNSSLQELKKLEEATKSVHNAAEGMKTQTGDMVQRLMRSSNLNRNDSLTEPLVPAPDSSDRGTDIVGYLVAVAICFVAIVPATSVLLLLMNRRGFNRGSAFGTKRSGSRLMI